MRILGWCVLLFVLTLILASSRAEHVRYLQYKAALARYEIQENAYNTAIADYRQELRAYYDDASSSRLPSSGELKVRVSISTVKTNQQKIGNEIRYTYKINGHAVSSGGKATVYLDQQNTVFTEIREDDPSYDDVGSASDTLQFSLAQLNDGVSVTQNISVHEAYGPDAGNIATYRVVYQLRLEEPLDPQSKTAGSEPAYPQLSKPVKPKLGNERIKWYFVLANDCFTQIVVIAAACLFAILTIKKTVSEIKANRKED